MHSCFRVKILVSINSIIILSQQMSDTIKDNPVELGSICYVNLDQAKKHGDFQLAINEARKKGKLIFANFAEWPG